MCEDRKKKRGEKKESHVFGSGGTCWPWSVLSPALIQNTHILGRKHHLRKSFKIPSLSKAYMIIFVQTNRTS